MTSCCKFCSPTYSLSGSFLSQYKYYLLGNSFHYLTSFMFTTERFPPNPELVYGLTLDFLAGCRYGIRPDTPFHPQNDAWHFLFETCPVYQWEAMHHPHEGHQDKTETAGIRKMLSFAITIKTSK